MALKHKIGPLTGTTSSPQITITVWDGARVAIDTAEAVAHAVSVAPVTVFGNLQTADPGVEELSDPGVVRVSISYSAPELQPQPSPPPREMGTLARRANCQAKSITRTRCLEPIAVYDDAGEITDDYGQMKWLCGVAGGGAQPHRVAARTFDPYPESRTLDFFAPNTLITDAYLDAIEALVVGGAFNDGDYKGCPQGSLQLVRFSLSERTPNDWELSFGFAKVPPQSAVEIDDDIAIPTLRGSWAYWTYDKEIYIPDSNILRVQTQFVVVQRVWPEADFGVLQLPESVTYPEGESE